MQSVFVNGINVTPVHKRLTPLCVGAIVVAALAIAAAVAMTILYFQNKNEKTCTSANVVNPSPGTTLMQRSAFEKKVSATHVSKPSGSRLAVVHPERVSTSTSSSHPATMLASVGLPPAPVPVPTLPGASSSAPGTPVTPVAPTEPAASLPPSRTEVSAQGLQKATAAELASAMYATYMNGASVSSALKPPDQGASSTPGPGGVKGKTVLSNFTNSGGLQSMIQHIEGETLQHQTDKRGFRAADLSGDFQESDMHAFDPENAKKLDKALALTGTPSRFHNTEVEEAIASKTNLLQNLYMAGKVDPSIHEVMSLAAPVVATRSSLNRAMASAQQLQASMIARPPLRHMYEASSILGLRAPMPLPPVTTTSTPDFNMYPGQEHHLISASCDAAQKPLTHESY